LRALFANDGLPGRPFIINADTTSADGSESSDGFGLIGSRGNRVAMVC
jgi:hypothetical protein